MVLCLLSRDSHGDTTKLNHEETVRGPEIAIFPGKSEILLLIPRNLARGKLFLFLSTLIRKLIPSSINPTRNS